MKLKVQVTKLYNSDGFLFEIVAELQQEAAEIKWPTISSSSKEFIKSAYKPPV
jgi:hypothetical protein